MKYFTLFFSCWDFKIQCVFHTCSTSHCRASCTSDASQLQVTTYQGAQFHERCAFNISHCDYELGCYSFSISVSFYVLRLCYWSEVAQSCPTLCDPMDCSRPGSSVHVIFQAWILEWVAISFSRRSSWPRDLTWVSHIVVRCFTIWATREALVMLIGTFKFRSLIFLLDWTCISMRCSFLSLVVLLTIDAIWQCYCHLSFLSLFASVSFTFSCLWSSILTCTSVNSV